MTTELMTPTPKIKQLLFAPDNAIWQGVLIGLGDDGVTYVCNDSGRWESYVPPLGWKEMTL